MGPVARRVTRPGFRGGGAERRRRDRCEWSPDKGARGLSHPRASVTIARKLARRCFHTLRELGPDPLAPVA